MSTTRDKLAEHEAVIAKDPTDYIATGLALAAIRDGRLYPQPDFTQYCQTRWGLSMATGWQIMASARAATDITDAGLPAPANEFTARAVARVAPEDRVEVWKVALELADGDTPKSTTVRAARTQTLRRAARPAPRLNKRGHRIPPRSQRAALTAGIATLQGLCGGIDQIDAIDPAITQEEAAQWVRDLSSSLRVLRSLTTKLKEHANGNHR